MTDPRGTIVRTQRGLFLLWEKVPGGMIVAPVGIQGRVAGRLDVRIVGAIEITASGLADGDLLRKVWKSYLIAFANVFTLMDQIPREVVGRVPPAVMERIHVTLRRAAGSIATEARQRMG